MQPVQVELISYDAGIREHPEWAKFFEELQVAGIPDWQTKSAPGGIRTPAHTDSKSAALSTELQAQPKGAAQDCPRFKPQPSQR